MPRIELQITGREEAEEKTRRRAVEEKKNRRRRETGEKRENVLYDSWRELNYSISESCTGLLQVITVRAAAVVNQLNPQPC